MLSFKIIQTIYLSVPLASPAAKLTKVRVGQVGFLPRQDSLTIHDDDNYDYCDDNDDDDEDAWHFFSWSSPEDNRRQRFQIGRHPGLCPPGVLLVLWSKVNKEKEKIILSFLSSQSLDFSNPNLVIFICMPSYQFSGAVGQEFVLKIASWWW